MSSEEIVATEKAVGQLLPVLVNRKGEVVDGRHRLKANKNWKRMELDLDPLQTHVARLVINTQRRVAESTDYDELAEYLVKQESVEPGQITGWISKLTGISVNVVWRNLSQRFKAVTGGPSSIDATVRRTHQVVVPEVVAEPLRKAIDELQDIVQKHPEKIERIVHDFNKVISRAPTLARPLIGGPVNLGPDKRKGTDAPASFLLKLTKHAAATEFLTSLPIAMIRKIFEDMEPDDRRSYQKLVSIIVANTRKLEEAVRA